jgi:hypothetical protein
VKVEAVGREMAIFLNNTLTEFKIFSSDRFSGNATVFVSSPWYRPALASISSMNMKAISSLSGHSSFDYSGPIIPKVILEKVFVPTDYAFTFDITPHSIVSETSSVIHFSLDGSDTGPKGRSPGLSF